MFTEDWKEIVKLSNRIKYLSGLRQAQTDKRTKSMGLLQGKTALITGASKGIGRKIAEKFAAEGANVAFTYLSSVEKGEALESELQSAGTKVKGYRSDASKLDQAEKLIADIVSDFGGIDIIVNNAGITKDGLLMRMSEDQWDDVINVNLKSVFNITKAASKVMMKARKGVFINMSSVVGVTGNAGQSNYAASKAGIIGFTKSIAKELGSRNIRANVVAPGFIRTEMTEVLDPKVVEGWEKDIPLKRAGETEDVANVCVFLASDMSAYVTGQTISVCGGML
ncbi:3-oxoacyl-[acyl-carrier protein] reductase [Pedobacter sp. UYP30]